MGPQAVDALLRDLCKNVHDQAWRQDYLFGGRVFIISGDWRQILPVIKRGSRATIVAATLKRSHLWQDIKRRFIHGNMRIARLIKKGANRQVLEKFEAWLLAIGEGSEPEPVILPRNMLLQPNSKPIDLIHTIFGDFKEDAEARSAKHLTSRSVPMHPNHFIYQYISSYRYIHPPHSEPSSGPGTRTSTSSTTSPSTSSRARSTASSAPTAPAARTSTSTPPSSSTD